MSKSGLTGGSSGITIFLWGALLSSACGAPKRDFGAAVIASAGGSDGGAPNAGGRTSQGGTEARGSKSGGAGGVPTSIAGADSVVSGGSAGQSVASSGSAGQGEAMGGAAGVEGVPLPVTECQPLAQRSCADAGLRGSCASGTQSCSAAGNWGTCSVVPKATDSCVTGNDDSCNGVPNENCGCVIGAERLCQGAQGNCATGKQTCPNGAWSACSILPKAQDVCTPGDDTNCNGKPNEGCTCTDGAVQDCGATAVGICKPGKSTCAGGAWGACIGAVVAAPRDCSSSLDNDCNGIADNTLDGVCQCKPAQQQACQAHPGLDGKGICKAGIQTCSASSNKTSSSWATCAGSVAPGTRNCSSSTDNDCNGIADTLDIDTCKCAPGAKQTCGAHAGLDGKGICKAGSQSCIVASNNGSSAWDTNCAGAVGPSPRNCGSAADNDCNGTADNAQDSVCQCNPVASSCAAGAKCKSSVSASQCVGCLVNADCNNGTCSAANSCVCTFGYAGTHCEFLAFQGIGVGGDAQSIVNNVSHDGTIVVGYTSGTFPNPTFPHHPLRWANGVLTAISAPANLALTSGCDATAVDANGVVVGFCQSNPFQNANGTTTATSLTPTIAGSVLDVSKDGKVMVGVSSPVNDQQGFHRVSGAFSLLPKLGTDFSRALGTNGDGTVIAGEEYIFFHTAWYWSSATGTQQLAQAASGDGFGNYFTADVSTDGKVIVGYSWDGYAIRWSGASYAQFQTTPNSAYASTNQDGSVSVGTLTLADNSTAAAIWDASGRVHLVTDILTNANLTGWTLTSATGVSDDGKVVVGNGLFSNQVQGWIAHLP